LAFLPYLGVSASSLDRTIVVTMLDALTQKGSKTMAARTRAYGNALYEWGMKRGVVASNPFAKLPVTPSVRRERVLADDELAAIWRATDGPGSFNAITKMLILELQWREETAWMHLSDISDDFSVWTIPASRAKNGKAHIVPLSAAARAIMQAQPCDGDL